MDTTHQSLTYLYPNSYMQGRPNFRRGFGGQYNRNEHIGPNHPSPKGSTGNGKMILNNLYLQSVMSIPFSYDLPLNLSQAISIKWIEKSSRCVHIEKRCSKLIQTALRKLNQSDVYHPELISIMMATCEVDGNKDSVIVKSLKKILNIQEDNYKEQDHQIILNEVNETQNHNMDFMSPPLTVEHLRSASDPYTYKSLGSYPDNLPAKGTSCESSCNTSSTSSVDGSKSELNNTDDERLNGHELNTILRRLHRCIVLRLANRKQTLSEYHQELNNLENSLKKILQHIPDNFTPGNLIPKNVNSNELNSSPVEKQSPEDVIQTSQSHFVDEGTVMNHNSIAQLRTGHQVAKTTAIRFERLCTDISSVIRLLCQLAKRVAIFEGRKLVNSVNISSLIAGNIYENGSHTESGYYNDEYIDQQIDCLQKRIDEAQTLREELENNRKRLLQSIPPWLTFKDKETSQLPMEFNGEVRQHLADFIVNLSTTSVHFNVMKTLVNEDENFCQIINETLNDISFIQN